MLYLTIFPCNTNQDCFSPNAKQKKELHHLLVGCEQLFSMYIQILVLGGFFLTLGGWTTSLNFS